MNSRTTFSEKNDEESKDIEMAKVTPSQFDSTITAKPVVAIKAVTRLPSFWKDRHRGHRETPLTQGNHPDIFITEADKQNVLKRHDVDNIQTVSARERWINKIYEKYIKDYECRQVVILGSGFDTRPYKKNSASQQDKDHAHIYREVKHFEIDKQKILDEKEKIFKENNIDKNAVYIGMDYVKDNFIEKLTIHGAHLNAFTLIIWEGNWMYLEDHEVKKVLTKIKDNFKNYVITFDYFNSDLLHTMRTKFRFNIWQTSKSGIGDIENFAHEHGMYVVSQTNSYDLVRNYNVDNNPSEDLKNYSVCSMTNR